MVLLVLAIAAGNASGAAGNWSYWSGTDTTAKAEATNNGQAFDHISINLTAWNTSNSTKIEWSDSTSSALYFANATPNGTHNALGTGDNGTHYIHAYDGFGNLTLNITSGVVISSFTVTFTEVGNPLNNTTVSGLEFNASNLYFIPDACSTQVGTNKTLFVRATGVQGGGADSTYTKNATLAIASGSGSAGAYLYNSSSGVWAKSVRVRLSAGAATVTFNGTSVGSVTVSANSTGADLVNATPSATVTVSAGGTDHFDVTASPTSTRAGEPISTITVKAMDKYDNQVTDFTGAVTFTSNSTAATTIWAGDPARDQIRLPANYTFLDSNGGQKDFTNEFNDTVNETVEVTVTHSGGTATGSVVITVGSANAYYVGIGLGATGNKTAGVEFNATATIYDVFYNVNYSSISVVHVNCSAPNAVASVNTTTGQPVGSNNTTIAALNSPTLVYVNLTNSTLEDIWGEPNFNLTANCTGLLPYPENTSSPGTNNTSIEGIEVVPNNASKLYTWYNLSTFQANGRARETDNVTIFLRDAYDNNCTKTTNATGVQVEVDFALTGVNATNASFSNVSTDTPAGSMVQTLAIPANNSTGMAIAKVYLWSNKALSETLDLTINITNAQGLTNVTPDVLCNVTPWKVDHINITFSRDPIVANGTDAAVITAYLEDDDNVIVTTACFNVTFDFNTTDPGANATGQLNVSNTTTVQASSGVVTGVSVNATKTNAVAGVDDPIQKLNVTANVTDSAYTLLYSTGGNWSLLNVTPGPAAWIDVTTNLPTQTVGGGIIVNSTIRDANMNIVLNGTTVAFRTTSGLINMSERTVMGQASPSYTSPYVASTATITATADVGSNTTDVVFTAAGPDCTPYPPACTYMLYLSDDSAPADGTTTVTVTVHLPDGYNNTNTVTNATVYLSTTRGTFAAAEGELVNGMYQTTLASSTPGSATVTANVGNWGQDTEPMTFTEVAFDDNITLSNGWNLISVPKTLNDPTDAYTVFSLGANDLVQYYDGSTWTTALNQPIEPCKAYWVKNNGTTKTVALSYKTITGAAIPPTVDLPAGWCMIGHTSTTPTAVDDALTSIAGKYSMVLTSPSTGVWETYIPSSSVHDFTQMQPGQGYWVFMKSSGTYAAIST